MKKLPVALFIFKRSQTLPKIFEKIRSYKPEVVYLIADGHRDDKEKLLVEETRTIAEGLIDWECRVIKNYADNNRGVYENIGQGASWVFEKEEKAVFLEDDNLPEESFFEFCEVLLEKYKNNEKIFWVCGTNYLKNYKSQSDYVFTKHMLPCGWASWANKYQKYYDGELQNFSVDGLKKLREKYDSKALYEQDVDNFFKTKRLLKTDRKKSSWDRQVAFSLRHYDLLGISPVRNQIRNIGVDEHSTHGGNSLKKTMTQRFCELDTIPISFPLRHPESILIEKSYEQKVEKVILLPLSKRVLMKIMYFIKPILGLRRDESLVLWLKDKVSNYDQKR